MKFATILITFLTLCCSIHYAISLPKFWKCNNIYTKSHIIFDCACLDNCQETIYNNDDFICDSVNITYNAIEEIYIQNYKLSQIMTLPKEKFSSLKELSMKSIKSIVNYSIMTVI